MKQLEKILDEDFEVEKAQFAQEDAQSEINELLAQIPSNLLMVR